MNKNFLNTCYPLIAQQATHFLLEDAPYIETELNSFAPKGKIRGLQISDKFLVKDTRVILLEYGLGYKAGWSRVIVEINNKQTYCFIESVFLQPLPELFATYSGNEISPTYTFPINDEDTYQPNETSPEINWKEQEKNVVYEDKRNGKFCIHYEIDITQVDGEQNLKQFIKQACYEGTSLILKSRGFNSSLSFATTLVDNYYIFSRAEEYYFPLRPCSTLRVLVTIPSRILYAKNINNVYILSPEIYQAVPAIPSAEAQMISSDTTRGDITTSDTIAGDTAEDKDLADDQSVIKLTYKNKSDLDTHFAYVLLNLSWYFGVFSFPPGRIWRITPTDIPDIIPGFGALNIPFEQNRLGNLFKEINEFIYKNVFEQVNLLQDTGKENFVNIYNTSHLEAKPEDFKSITDFLSFNKTNALDFNGELHIYVDKNNLELKQIKFFSNKYKLIPPTGINAILSIPQFETTTEEIQLNINSDAFYKNEAVLNKTSLNYLLKIRPPASFIEFLIPQIQQLSESEDITDFGKVVGGIITSANTILKSAEYLLGEKEQDLEKFLTENHYPTIDSVFAEPIDFGSCIDKLGSTKESRIAHLTASYNPQAKLDQINKFRSDIEKYKNGGGADLFIHSLTDIDSIQDENFKILIGKKKAKGPTESDKFNQFLAVANMFDWPRFLRESIKCSSAKFDIETFTNISNDYEKLEQLIKNPDLLLLCNPLSTKVQSILNQLVNFSLPELPIYNPQESLANELKQMVVGLINDLVVFAIRGLITGAIKDCTADNNPDFSDSPNSPKADAANNLANNIDRANNNREIDSFLNDYFGLNDELDNISSDAVSQNVIRARFKEILKSFLDDVLACLTTKELCTILTGGSLEDEAYDVVFFILRKKYDTPQNKFNLAKKLNSKEEINLFFKKIKSIYNLSVCEDIVNDDGIIFPKNPRCDDGRKEARERAILLDKGIPEDLIDDLLNDIKEKDEEGLRKVLDFLNKENPFDLNNIPTVLCKKGPNGEVIPPLVSLSPPVKSFNKMLDSIYVQIYDNFEEDAKLWYKNTYSLSSSAPKNNLKFDTNTGQIVFDNSPRTGETNNNPSSPTETALPSYIFKDSLENKLIIQNIDNAQLTLDGNKEQSLELNFINSLDRESAQKVYKEFKDFSESLLHLLDCYKILVISDNINNFADKSDLNQFLEKDFSAFLKIMGSFYANSVAVINDPERNGIIKRVLNFSDADYANAFFAEDKPISLISKLMSYIKDTEKPDFKKNLIDVIKTIKLNSVHEAAKAEAEKTNVTYKDPETFLLPNSTLLTEYEKFNFFNSYKKFVVTENVLNAYPTYKLELKNTSSLVKLNETTNRLELYDSRQMIINKNGYDYINRKFESIIDNDILNYITGTLNIDSGSIKTLTKKDIFNRFITISKNKYSNSVHTSSIDFSLNKKEQFLNQKIFDDFSYYNNPSSILEPNFEGIKQLLSKQMDDNILLSSFFNTVNNSVSMPPVEGANKPKEFPGPPSGDNQATIKHPNFDNGPPKNNLPLTQYLALRTNQTPVQKACNIRPHYLDIDSIKSEAATAKEESYCLEEAKNEKIKKGEEINTSELSNIELNDTQYIMLDSTYRLYIRTHLHEIMLRAISIYGFYDPQTIRKNDIFLTVMTDLLESEIRSKNNTLFMMMVGYFAKVFQFKNPQITEIPNYKNLLKQVVSQELKNNVLPKMSKRILEDTNLRLAFLNPPKKITLTTVDDYYRESNKILYVNPEDKSVYIRVTGTKFVRPQNPNNNNSSAVFDSLSTLIDKNKNAQLDVELENLKYFRQDIYFIKIYESNIEFKTTGTESRKSELVRDFGNSIEYKFLFKYIFSLSDELVFRHFAAVFGCGTKKASIESFKTVKNTISMICQKMTSNGIDVAPDPNNFQDMVNNDSSNIFIKFIIDSLISAPISIVKGFTELTEPNIALSSKAYMLTKTFIPETPSFMVPAISFPLGIPIPPVFPLGIIPWVNIPLALFYLIGGLWYEEDKGPNDPLVSDFLKKLVDNAGKEQKEIDCSTVTNPDRMQISQIYDGDPGYNIFEPSKDFIVESPLTKLEEAEERKKLLEELEKISFGTNIVAPSTTQTDKSGRQLSGLANTISNARFNPMLPTNTFNKNNNLTVTLSSPEILTSEPVISQLAYKVKNSEYLSYPDPYVNRDEIEASRDGTTWLIVWEYFKKPNSYLALKNIVETEFNASGETSFKQWLKNQLPDINLP